MSVLEVKNLRTAFRTRKGIIHAVNDVSFTLDEGKTLALVGESGSGKSVSAMSILRLLDGNGYIESGEILFTENGKTLDLAKLPLSKMYEIRGNRISVVFQEPMTALNPVFSVQKQLCEPFLIHQGMKKADAKARALEMLASVKIPAPERVLKQYPHQLSGGMRQRVMIAMALACKPKILIADEPTTALDVTIQAQILKLMRELQSEKGTAILFITHDLGVVNEIADDVAVMYCGQVVERVEKYKIFSDSPYSHPYTEGLLASAPRKENLGKKLDPIVGNVPHPFELPQGCKFAPRCKYCTQKCVDEEPELFAVPDGQYIRCFYPEKEYRRSAKHRKLIVRNFS
ncbi:MAG: ABC transporter ATP-binding protein [Clostridia bacterium]|nr:ABC transporter ATP-binding protein [Clostridia bacterium]